MIDDKHRGNTDVQTIQILKSNVPSLKTALYVGHGLHQYWRSPLHPSNRVGVFCANQYYRHVKSPYVEKYLKYLFSPIFWRQKACSTPVALTQERRKKHLLFFNRNQYTKIHLPISTRVSIFSISDSNSLSLSKLTHLSEFSLMLRKFFASTTFRQP